MADQKPAPRDREFLDALASAIPGGLCRCAKCCCKPDQGHRSPQFAVYDAEMRAVERYEDAVATGLSDFEAREEGWPSRCDMANDRHVTPHVGCILR